jgi:hypothetical protein
MRLARRVCTALSETYHVNGHEVTSSASIGIAIGPLDREAPDTLLKNADLALYRAKEDGRNTFRFFEPAMDAKLQKRRRLENDLRNARTSFISIISPSSTWGAAGSPAMRRWCAGGIRATARFRRPFSCRSPRRPASSCRSANGS